jgi:hypothetical protein
MMRGLNLGATAASAALASCLLIGEFRSTVEDHSSTDSDVRVAFERLSRSCHAVRDEVDHSDSRTARSDLQPVTDSYLDIEREMGGYPGHPEHHARVD